MEKRLLIVDDNIEIAEIITEFISDLFDHIDRVSSVDSAKKAVSENTYVLIFLDINVANRNGAEVVKFLIDSEGNPNQETPFIIISGIITPQFIDRYNKRFAGILMKPFDQDDIRKITEEIMGLREIPKIKSLAETPIDEISNMKCELPFSLSQLEHRVRKRLEQVKKSTNVKYKVTQMKIDRSEEKRYSSHIDILINASVAISIQMEWNTDKTLEKYIYAAYLHDMALINYPDCLKVNTLEELENLKSTITPEEYKLIIEHPNIAANNIESMKEIPPDVAMIIKQHHELPKGGGFPTGCTYHKITSFSAVFIIAHDLTEYILENSKWSIEDYIIKAQPKFQSSIFSRILKKLPKIK